MSNWQKGDLALCVRGGFPRDTVAKILGQWRTEEGEEALRSGAVYTVEEVSPYPTDEGWIGLKFREVSGSWISNRFRKINPPKADEFDREVIDLMAGKKVDA